jgi:hypothetical protein
MRTFDRLNNQPRSAFCELAAVRGSLGNNGWPWPTPTYRIPRSTQSRDPISCDEQSSDLRSSLAYGQQYGAAPPEHPQGTLILIFGIIGIFFSLFGAIAWYLGANAMKEIQATGIRYSNESNINTGRILGKIVTIIALVGLGIAFVLWLLFALIFAVRLSGL